jgi:hypothetical protein
MPDPTPIPILVPELSIDVKIPNVVLVKNVNTSGIIPVVGFGGVGTLSYVINPTLPAGLTFLNSSGTIVGNPTVAIPRTTYTVTVVDKTPQSIKATFNLLVANAQVKIDPVDWIPLDYQVDPLLPKKFGYFAVTDNVSLKNFIVKINNEHKVTMARAVINGDAPMFRIEGNLVVGTQAYNPSWSYHIDPNSVEFFFVDSTSCRFPFTNIESNVANISTYITPGLICNWHLVAETTNVDEFYQRGPRTWNPNNQSHGIYVNGESVLKTANSFTQFCFVSGSMPGNLTITTTGNIVGNVENPLPSLTDAISEYQFTLAMSDNSVANLTATMISIADAASVTLGSNVANVFSNTTNLTSLITGQGNIQIVTYSSSVITGRPYYQPNHNLSNVYNF